MSQIYSEEFETDRLLITTAREKYAMRLAQYYDKNREWFDPFEVPKKESYYTGAYQLSSMQYEISAMEKGQAMYYYVFLKNDPGRIIGTISYSRIRQMPYKSTIFGYDFDHDIWGNGYATEACNATNRMIFKEFDLHRIEARVSEENTRSVRMLERMGVVFEGKEFGSVFIQGAFRDHLRYALLNHDMQ